MLPPENLQEGNGLRFYYQLNLFNSTVLSLLRMYFTPLGFSFWMFLFLRTLWFFFPMLIGRNDRTGVIGVVCADFTFYSFLFILDIFWSIFFFPRTTYIRGMHGKRGVICTSVVWLCWCVYIISVYALSLCLIVSHIISGLLKVVLNLSPCTAY